MSDQDDDCAAKHCDEAATLGMTLVYGDLRVEVYLCVEHFDALSDWFDGRAEENEAPPAHTEGPQQ